MRSSSTIFRVIRNEVFRQSQTKFGKRFGLTKGTILRLEGRKAGHHVTLKHLRWLRDIKAPSGKAEGLQALLDELEASIREEMRAEGFFEGLASEDGTIVHQAGKDQQIALVERSEAAARRSEDAAQLCLAQEARRAEESRRVEEAAERAEMVAHRAERLCLEDVARRAEETRQREDAARQAEQAAQRAEQQLEQEKARRTEDARQREEAVRRADEATRRIEMFRIEEEARCVQEARQRGEVMRRAEEAAQRVEHLLVEDVARRAEDARQRQEVARRAEQAAQRAEHFCREEEARRVEDVREREEAARCVEQAAERVEQLFREGEARRAEEALNQEERTRRSEVATERAEKLCVEQETRRKAEAQTMEDAAKLRVSERRQVRRLAVATLAASTVLGVLGGAAAGVEAAVRRVGLAEMAHADLQDNARHETPPADHGFVVEGSPDSEEMLSAGLDGGTELTRLATQALPFPKGALPQQLASPCPEATEEINGYCWSRLMLTPTQVKSGACDYLRMYEPSDGWCRANRAGYKPVYATRKKNNAVEPQ